MEVEENQSLKRADELENSLAELYVCFAQTKEEIDRLLHSLKS